MSDLFGNHIVGFPTRQLICYLILLQYMYFSTSGLSLCLAQDTFYFNLKPHDQSVVEGTEQTLLCDVSNRRHIKFEWIHNGKQVTNTSRRFQEGRNLRILRVTREEDSGTFQCIATNVTTGYSLQSGEASLDIQCKFVLNMSHLVRKPTICIGENKDADQLRGNREADQRLCFRYLNPKFQASGSFLCLYRLVCVGPVRKPHCWFFHEAAHIIVFIFSGCFQSSWFASG